MARDERDRIAVRCASDAQCVLLQRRRALMSALIEEGQALRREFGRRTAPMRAITAEDLGRRSR
jgi:hypothetical protein